MVAAPQLRRAFTLALLVWLSATLAYAVFFLSTPIAQADRIVRGHRNIYLLAVGLVGLPLCFYARSASSGTGWNRAAVWLALLVPSYAAFQILPLPLFLVRAMSPARAELIDALAPLSLAIKFPSLSVAPSVTMVHFVLFAAYMVVFIAIREITRSAGAAPWLTVFPILAIAVWQAGWGLAQSFGGDLEGFAHGTYPVRNHFAGLLEMALPFAVAYAAAALGRRRQFSTAAAIKACAGFAVAGLVFSGIVYSLSRMGFIATAGSLFSMGTLALIARLQGKGRWTAIALLCLAVVIGAAFLAPIQLILRFSEHSTEGRLDVWRDTLHLIAAYPLVGCGLGGYESALERFKTSNLTFTQDYAHNDYLQFFAELGFAGFAIAGAFLLAILILSIRTSLRNSQTANQWIGLACSGALVAILIHSLADFNLYVTANATMLAWICGIAAGNSLDPRQRHVINPRGAADKAVEFQ